MLPVVDLPHNEEELLLYRLICGTSRDGQEHPNNEGILVPLRQESWDAVTLDVGGYSGPEGSSVVFMNLTNHNSITSYDIISSSLTM
jgi:hypothetical protein